ncbi:MAG: FAD:protein FMN transferase [Planctomycetota bacterium]
MAEPIVVKLARPAMATEFEILLWGEDRSYLRSVGEEALDEIEAVERKLSLFVPTSDIAAVNARAARQPVRVAAEVFDLLKRAVALSRESGGAFDITTAPLSRCWGFHAREGRIPTEEEIAEASSLVGADNIFFCEYSKSIRLAKVGMSIDLGGIGKGYAVERAAGIVREHDVPGGLIHGGTSTIYAIGAPPDREGWPIGIVNPLDPTERLAVVHLKDQALSTSRGTGKCFEVGGRRYGHILDPRTGYPAEGILSATAICPSPTDADALSTAFAIFGIEETKRYCDDHPSAGAIVFHDEEHNILPQMTLCGVIAEEAVEKCLIAAE